MISKQNVNRMKTNSVKQMTNNFNASKVNLYIALINFNLYFGSFYEKPEGSVFMIPPFPG